MSQKTNLNVSPYYDDFDANQNFYRVLFRPGFPVQSRELTTVQSILQNQIESLGNNIFKDGSVVIPGNVTYNSLYYAVKHISPSIIASIPLGEPIIASIIAFYIFKMSDVCLHGNYVIRLHTYY